MLVKFHSTRMVGLINDLNERRKKREGPAEKTPRSRRYRDRSRDGMHAN